jgi:hypothetical protein
MMIAAGLLYDGRCGMDEKKIGKIGTERTREKLRLLTRSLVAYVALVGDGIGKRGPLS